MEIKKNIALLMRINWVKTIYFNFKKFPFKVAKKLPVFFYGKVKFQDISGSINITAPICTGMIQFGLQYEMATVSKNIAEIMIAGVVEFKGYAQFGKDVFLYVGKQAYAQFGNMTGLASNTQFICVEKITLGNYARFGADSQIMDSHFHPMINTLTKTAYPVKGKIEIGNYNYVSSRVTIMPNTKTPDFCTIASNSLCNKDYTGFSQNILIGGIPAKLLKENTTRDWDTEIPLLKKWLLLKFN